MVRVRTPAPARFIGRDFLAQRSTRAHESDARQTWSRIAAQPPTAGDGTTWCAALERVFVGVLGDERDGRVGEDLSVVGAVADGEHAARVDAGGSQ